MMLRLTCPSPPLPSHGCLLQTKFKGRFQVRRVQRSGRARAWSAGGLAAGACWGKHALLLRLGGLAALAGAQGPLLFVCLLPLAACRACRPEPHPSSTSPLIQV